MDFQMGIDWPEVVRRALKYLFEGLAVGLAAYFIPGKKLRMEEILMIAVSAAAIYSLLDLYAPTIGGAARIGTGLAVGTTVGGGIATGLPM